MGDETLNPLMSISPETKAHIIAFEYALGRDPETVASILALLTEPGPDRQELIDMASEKGYRLQKPFHAEVVTMACSMIVGSVRDSFRMISTSMEAILSGEQSGQLPCLLNTVALDEKVTMMYDMTSRFNPRPNFSHLMVSNFGIVLRNFYVWSESVTVLDIVKEFVFNTIIDADVDGPVSIGDTVPLNAGAFPFLTNQPDPEDG